MLLAARRLNHSWLWMGATTADQSGNAGMYVSGNAISAAPWRAASSMRLHALATVFSASRNTGATCAAATRYAGYAVGINSPPSSTSS